MTKNATTTLVAAALVLSGCGGGSPAADEPVVTVTTTPTVTAGISPRSATTMSTKKPPSASDDVGRAFDLGTIVKLGGTSGTPVLTFDRWSARGMSDTKLAAGGVPMRVHSDAPFENVNTRTTFRIPVTRGAMFTYNHCVSIDQPVQQRSSTLKEFVSLAGSEKIMLLTLDSRGRVVKAENDPAC